MTGVSYSLIGPPNLIMKLFTLGLYIQTPCIYVCIYIYIYVYLGMTKLLKNI